MERQEFGYFENAKGESEQAGYLPKVDPASQLRRAPHLQSLLSQLNAIPVAQLSAAERLERAKNRIDLLRQEVADYYRNFRVTPDLIELRNLVEVADLIIRSALSRHESRGLHYTLDYSETALVAEDTVLVP